MGFDVEATCPTHRVELYVGLREGYDSTVIRPIADVEDQCRRWARDHGFSATVTPTTLFYRDDEEPAAIVGLIRNPRFREYLTAERLNLVALRFAFRLLDALNQERIYLVADDVTTVVRRIVDVPAGR